MALGAATIWEVRIGGADTSGGGFNPGNANGVTDIAVSSADTAAPVATTASYTFVAGDVGHWLFIKSGTNSIPGWYQIASVAAGAATLNATAGAAILYEGATATRPSTATGCGTAASLTNCTGMMDYSQSDSPIASLTDLGTTPAGSTTATSASAPFNRMMVGNLMRVASGTNLLAAKTVEITAYTSTSQVTIDSSLDDGVGGIDDDGVAKIGGAAGSMGMIAPLWISLNYIWITAGADPESNPFLCSNSSNVSGGRITLPASISVLIRGYLTKRGDITTVGGLRPVLKADANSVVIWSGTNNTLTVVRDIVFDGAKATRTGTSATGSNVFWYGFNLTARNCSNSGFTGTSVRLSHCSALDNTGSGFPNGNIFNRCVALRNTSDGFSGGGFVVDCLAAANGGDGFKVGATLVFTGNTSIGNTGDGFEANSAGSNALLTNCVAYGNGGYGLRVTSGSFISLHTCAFGSNTSGVTTGTIVSEIGTITLTADPSTNAAGYDYSLNNTAGGGAALRGAAFPTTLPGSSTTNTADLGASQSTPSAGGGGISGIIGG